MQTIWLGEPGEEDNEEEEEPVYEEPGGGEKQHLDKPDEYGYDYEQDNGGTVNLDTQSRMINWRGRLSEYCQKQDMTLPDVNEINTVGARGTFSFVCKFHWGKSNSAPLLILRTCGTAKKKKFAKREAARLMCKRLSDLTEFERPLPNEHNPEDRGYWGPTFPACPRSADESGKVCPPLGYEEFDHSEPLPDLEDYEYEPESRSMYLSKRNSSWDDYPPSKRRRFPEYDSSHEASSLRGPWMAGREDAGRTSGSLFL